MFSVDVEITPADPTANPQTVADYGTDFSLYPAEAWGSEEPITASYTIAKDETTEEFDLIVWNDGVPEENETVELTITSPTACCGEPVPYTVDNEAASASVTIEDNDWWSVKFERGAPSGSEPNAIERLAGVVQDYGYYRAKRYDANTEDNCKATDVTYSISYTFWTTGTATRTTDFSLSAIAATGTGGEYEAIVGAPSYGGVVVQGAVSYDTWSSSIPVGLTEAYIRVEPVFDWLDEGEPGNRADAPSAADEAAYGEYIDGSLVTATWAGKPSTYDAVVPTADGEKRVVIHDGGIIRIRTDSDNNGTIDSADDDTSVKHSPAAGRIVMRNDNDNNDDEILDLEQSPVPGEEDLAQVDLYVWVDSLVPKDASTLQYDVSLSGSTAFALWGSETKGNEIPWKEPITNPPETAVLATLEGASNTYQATIYLEGLSAAQADLTLRAESSATSVALPTGTDYSRFTVVHVDVQNPNDTNDDDIVNDFAAAGSGNLFTYTGDVMTAAATMECIIPVRVRITPNTAEVRSWFDGNLTAELETVTNGTFTSVLTWDHATAGDPSVGQLVYNATTEIWEAEATFTGLPAVPADSWGRVPEDLENLLPTHDRSRIATITADSPQLSGDPVVREREYEMYYGKSLVIGGEPMAETSYNYTHYIEPLISDGAGGVDSLRREMYDKMNCSTRDVRIHCYIPWAPHLTWQSWNTTCAESRANS